MIYNIDQIGSNILSLNETVPDDSYILAVLYEPCNNNSTNINGDKKTVLTATKCNGMVEVNFEGVAELYEDLTDELIYFSERGTWKTNIYHQLSATNTDVNQATFLDEINLQVV